MPRLKNKKQELFCQEYCRDLNKTKAAIRAGFSEKSASDIGYQLSKKPEVSARIGELFEARATKLELDASYVLQGLVEVKERCMQAKPVMVFDPVERRMVHDTTINEHGDEVGVYTFDSKGANNALELMGKHLGMFVDRVAISEDVPRIVDDVPDGRT